MKIVDYVKLIRPWQWYKNLLIFLAIFFVGEFFEFSLFEKVIYGFIALCLVSSANYILNDILDKNKDRVHPEKKNRPIASGKVSTIEASIIFIVLLSAGFLIAYSLSIPFLIITFALFLTTLLYSLFLKNEPIVDMLIIAINFVIRAIAGTFIIHVSISPWLILCPFFLALFLAAGKRDADLRFVKNPQEHKKVLKYYNKEILHSILIISATSLITAYAIYALSKNPLLLLTVPIAIYLVIRYYSIIDSGSQIARHPEKIITDWRMIFAIILYFIIAFIVFYVPYVSSLAVYIR
ncbi:MAG: UbiA prenyltransferase family protein [Candidatus Woesearchaeota archaeon]